MKFSQREGYRPLKVLRREEVDEELRTAIWSVFWEAQNASMSHDPRNVDAIRHGAPYLRGSTLEGVYVRLWMQLLKRGVDELPIDLARATQSLKAFLAESPWFTVFDFMEHVLEFSDVFYRFPIENAWNGTLEREGAAYRIVQARVVAIVSQVEVDAIEEAANSTVDAIKAHISTALARLSDRVRPDYRNSIKESISAVEAAAKRLTGQPRATLGEALKTLKARYKLHPALMDAFAKLYGYTSDADGIRHAISEDREVDRADATYMLVVCSAFVNYLAAKT